MAQRKSQERNPQRQAHDSSLHPLKSLGKLSEPREEIRPLFRLQAYKMICADLFVIFLASHLFMHQKSFLGDFIGRQLKPTSASDLVIDGQT